LLVDSKNIIITYTINKVPIEANLLHAFSKEETINKFLQDEKKYIKDKIIQN